MDIKWIDVPNFFHKEVKVKKARHFIFFTKAQLIYMSEAHAWYIDGTFKIVRDPMKQLLTIHVVVLYEKQRCSIPVCFILMSRRRKIDYIAIVKEIYDTCVNYVQEESGNPNKYPKVSKIMADFEIALWQALRELKSAKKLPRNLILKGCYFHFAQATFRKVVECKLKKKNYVKKATGGARLFIKWLLVLVLLPKDLIEPTFMELLEKVKASNCKKLEKLFKYYYDNWIHGKNWDLDDICQWGCSVRTNNDAERFHMKLNGSADKTNVNFYDLINILGNFAQRAAMDAKIFALGLVANQQKKKTLKFEEVLLDSCGKLQRKEISNFQFLSNLTSAEHDNPLVDESWGVNFSRIDVMPEDEGYEPEDEDSTGSERIISSEDSSS